MKASLYAIGNTLPEAWERSIVALEAAGSPYPGRYYQNGMDMGRHAQMTIRIEHFTQEPRVHRGFTCDPADLIGYIDEVCHGTTRGWEYTYHGRINAHGGEYLLYHVDQYRYALECLCRKHDSHKAVISLGDPYIDAQNGGQGTHIPCLRTIQFELDKTEDGMALNTYLHWRARDAINAAFNNLLAFSCFAEMFATDLAAMLGQPVTVGGCVDCTDDYHVNGAHWALAQRVCDLARRHADERVWTMNELTEMAD